MSNLHWHNVANRRIIELMAGSGRNLSVYKHLFDRFEMLDGAKSMVNAMPKKVIKHHRDLENH